MGAWLFMKSVCLVCPVAGERSICAEATARSKLGAQRPSRVAVGGKAAIQ